MQVEFRDADACNNNWPYFKAKMYLTVAITPFIKVADFFPSRVISEKETEYVLAEKDRQWIAMSLQ